MASYRDKAGDAVRPACVVLATAIAWMTITIGGAAQATRWNVAAQLFQQAAHQEEAAGNLEGRSRLSARPAVQTRS